MATFTITNFVTTSQTLIGFETGLITTDGTLAAISGVAVDVTNFGTQINKLTVLGTLLSNGNNTAKAVNFDGADFNMFIGSDAHVLTPGATATAIDLIATDFVTIANHGSIFATASAIRSGSGDAFSSFDLINTGEISSGHTGISFLTQTGTVTINNDGSILGTRFGINNSAGAGNSHSTTLLNSGVIQGSNSAYTGSDGTDDIFNTGQILGDISLGEGNDNYWGSSGVVSGQVLGEGGSDIIYGGGSADFFAGGDGDDVLRGHGGDDELYGLNDNDTLRGGEGNDDLFGGNGTDRLSGQTGDDLLDGGGENDTLRGGDGNDDLFGGLGNDELHGQQGNDDLAGNAGDDALRGGYGDDVISGGGNTDTLKGGNGQDTLAGGSGNDNLNGGRDDDTLTGGGGLDDFVFGRNAGDDRITDFTNGSDQINLTAFGFKGNQYIAKIAPALSNAGGGDTFLDLDMLGGQGSVLIEGLAFSDADASDFIL